MDETFLVLSPAVLLENCDDVRGGELPQGFMLVTVSESEWDSIGEEMFQNEEEAGNLEWFLPTVLRCVGFRELPVGRLAGLFLHGTQQSCVLWDDGRVVESRVSEACENLPRSQWPGNYALRWIGVHKGDHVDEFEALGLGWGD